MVLLSLKWNPDPVWNDIRVIALTHDTVVDIDVTHIALLIYVNVFSSSGVFQGLP